MNGQSVCGVSNIRKNNEVSFSDLALSATDVARAAILESVPESHVGAFIDSTPLEGADEGVAIVAHTFACTSESYPGWYWSALVIGLDGQDYCTVSEVNLLPGELALVPSEWKPWAQRVQAGDLGVGDLLPIQPDDKRLTAGFTGLDDLAEDVAVLHPTQWELGLGREQILSSVGLDMAVDRWFGGDHGPRSAMAKSAPASCSTCGFLAPIGGSLGRAFGVCANEFGAADGQLVAMNFGCGAHSSVRPIDSAPVPVVPLVIDDVADESADTSDVADYHEDDAAVNSEIGTDEGLDVQETTQLTEGIDAEAPIDSLPRVDAEAPLDLEPEFGDDSEVFVEVAPDFALDNGEVDSMIRSGDNPED